GTLEAVGRNKTVDVIKYKQKSRYFKKNGHRQPWFKVKIDNIK
ncbi:MAG: bL21 family ribosomal protein, partial [Candidatus Paceibacterota bacterium]